MLTVTVEEIQRDPLKYLHQVEAGETLMIIRANQTVAELRPIAHHRQPSNQQNSQPLRPFGLCAGDFSVPDDFNAPLPEDMLSAFEGQ